MSRILVVGETLIDVVHGAEGSIERPGGGPANVAVTLGRQGCDVTLKTALGDDARGALAREWLAESGVTVEATALPHTSTAIARLDAGGSAGYTFDIAWQISPEVPGAYDCVHTGSIGSWTPPGAETAEAIIERLRAHALLSFDPNIRPSLIPDREAAGRRIRQLLHSAEIVKLSAEDLDWIAPGTLPADAAAIWLNANAAIVVITAGEHGALADTRDHSVIVAAPPTVVVDTIGAGDTFMGTLLSGLSAEGLLIAERRAHLASIPSRTLERVLARAAAAAAINVSRVGANPPRLDELPTYPPPSVELGG